MGFLWQTLQNFPATTLNTKVNIVAEQDVFTGDNNINLYQTATNGHKQMFSFWNSCIFIHVFLGYHLHILWTSLETFIS